MSLALEFKSIEYDCKPVDLSNGEQHTSEYKEINSLNQVPTLLANGIVVTQSMAILEFLEEFYPEKPKLLPTDAVQRAKVREICEVIDSIKNRSIAKVNKFGLSKTNQFYFKILHNAHCALEINLFPNFFKLRDMTFDT